MECLYAALILGLLALVLGPGIGVIVLLRRARRAEERLAEIESRVSRLGRLLDDLAAADRGAAPATGAEPEARPAPAPPPALIPSPEPPPAERPAAFTPLTATREEPPAEPSGAAAAPAPPPEPPFEPIEPAEPPEPPEPAPPPRRPPIEWERWLGVRGAAVLAGVLFALAGLYFVRFAVEAGWLAPPVRVALAILAGLGALVASEWLRPRGYEPTANGLAGGAVVVLYGAVWAARALYALIPGSLAFVLMVLVTATAGLLAWRHRTLVVALLGLAGGFATPLLVSTGADRPIGLFGYLLLLNCGLLVLARRRRWPLLAPLGLLATLGYEVLWIALRMRPEELPLALGILLVFAALFAAASALAARGTEDGAAEAGALVWIRIWTRSGAVLFPFAFALYLAVRADLGMHLWSVAALMLVLSVGAQVLDRSRGSNAGAGLPLALGTGAAAASVAVVAVWVLRTRADRELAWEAVAIALVLSVAFHAFAELDLRRGLTDRPLGPLLTAGGFLVLLVVRPLVGGGIATLTPWMVGWLALGALLVRQGHAPGVARRPVLAAVLVGLGFGLSHLAHAGAPYLPPPALYFGILVAAGVALQLQALYLEQRRDREGAPTREWPAGAAAPRWPEPAAAALPLAALATLAIEARLDTLLAPWFFLGLTLVLALLAVLAATRAASGGLYAVAATLTAVAHWSWSDSSATAFGMPATDVARAANVGLVGLGAGVVLFTAWPFLTRRRLAGAPAAWIAAALAGPVWFPALRHLWLRRFGPEAIGLLPVLLGALALAACWRVVAGWGPDDPRRRRWLAWFGAVALGFAALAIPLQLEREWITLGWALEGVAVVALWRRLDHPGLKALALALLAAVTARLVANPAVSGYHAHSAWPVLNWLLYTYLVPAACLVGASALLAPGEVARARPFEARIYSRGRPWGAVLCAAAAIAVIFVWIDLTVFDLFAPGRYPALAASGRMARDLTLSLAWALYALVLLGLGIGRRSRGLRAVGLGLLAIAVVKLFLFDLAGLEDLYRVASLVGLALSLVLVSLAYQRFVFRKPPPEGP